MHGIEKRIVYILRSDADPWSLVVSIEFPTEKAAVTFEAYRKSGSGRAFTKRHFRAARDC
jgi:hypothetical protein